MDHAYLESTVTSTLTEALTSLSLVMAKPSSQHPIIDPIDYLGKFLLHRRQPTDLPASLVQAMDLENNVISKYRELYTAAHPPQAYHEPQLTNEGVSKLESEESSMPNGKQETSPVGIEEQEAKKESDIEPSDSEKSNIEPIDPPEQKEIKEVEEKGPEPMIEANQEKTETEKETLPVETPQKEVEENPEQKEITNE